MVSKSHTKNIIKAPNLCVFSLKNFLKFMIFSKLPCSSATTLPRFLQLCSQDCSTNSFINNYLTVEFPTTPLKRSNAKQLDIRSDNFVVTVYKLLIPKSKLLSLNRLIGHFLFAGRGAISFGIERFRGLLYAEYLSAQLIQK